MDLQKIGHGPDGFLERSEIYMSVVLADGFGIVSHEFLNEGGAHAGILHHGSSGVAQAVKGQLRQQTPCSPALAIWLFFMVETGCHHSGFCHQGVKLVRKNEEGRAEAAHGIRRTKTLPARYPVGLRAGFGAADQWLGVAGNGQGNCRADERKGGGVCRNE